jgi:hypothetical protein
MSDQSVPLVRDAEFGAQYAGWTFLGNRAYRHEWARPDGIVMSFADDDELQAAVTEFSQASHSGPKSEGIDDK